MRPEFRQLIYYGHELEQMESGESAELYTVRCSYRTQYGEVSFDCSGDAVKPSLLDRYCEDVLSYDEMSYIENCSKTIWLLTAPNEVIHNETTLD